jgi:hypothetical protein
MASNDMAFDESPLSARRRSVANDEMKFSDIACGGTEAHPLWRTADVPVCPHGRRKSRVEERQLKPFREFSVGDQLRPSIRFSSSTRELESTALPPQSCWILIRTGISAQE